MDLTNFITWLTLITAIVALTNEKNKIRFTHSKYLYLIFLGVFATLFFSWIYPLNIFNISSTIKNRLNDLIILIKLQNIRSIDISFVLSIFVSTGLIYSLFFEVPRFSNRSLNYLNDLYRSKDYTTIVEFFNKNIYKILKIVDPTIDAFPSENEPNKTKNPITNFFKHNVRKLKTLMIRHRVILSNRLSINDNQSATALIIVGLLKNNDFLIYTSLDLKGLSLIKSIMKTEADKGDVMSNFVRQSVYVGLTEQNSILSKELVIIFPDRCDNLDNHYDTFTYTLFFDYQKIVDFQMIRPLVESVESCFDQNLSEYKYEGFGRFYIDEQVSKYENQPFKKALKIIDIWARKVKDSKDKTFSETWHIDFALMVDKTVLVYFKNKGNYSSIKDVLDDYFDMLLDWGDDKNLQFLYAAQEMTLMFLTSICCLPEEFHDYIIEKLSKFLYQLFKGSGYGNLVSKTYDNYISIIERDDYFNFDKYIKLFEYIVISLYNMSGCWKVHEQERVEKLAELVNKLLKFLLKVNLDKTRLLCNTLINRGLITVNENDKDLYIAKIGIWANQIRLEL